MFNSKRFKLLNRHNLTIRGKLWNYQGGDSVVLFIHGFAGFMSEPQYVALRKELVKKDYCVVTFDQTNSLGASDKDPEFMSYEEFKSDINTVLTWLYEEKGIRKIHLVGHSLGGGMSIELLNEDRKGITFVSTTVINPLIKADNTMITGEKIRHWKDSGHFVLKRFFTKLKVTRAAMQSMEDFDIQNLAEHITTPIFFVVGVFDKTIPNQQAIDFAENMKAEHKLTQYPFLGHTFFHKNALDNIDIVVRDIIEWIESHNGVQR